MIDEAKQCVKSCREWYQAFSNFGKGDERSVKELLAVANMIESLSEIAERASAKAALCDSVKEDCNKLRRQLEQVTRERDAAVKDLSAYRPCDACGYEPQEDACMRCRSYTDRPYWKWRGVEVEEC